MKAWLLISLGCALASAPRPSHACDAALPAGDLGALPDAWRQALQELVTATHHASQPWGCPGGQVAIALDDGSARLAVTRADGSRLTRPVRVPGDVLPTGKAMLAHAEPVAARVEPPAEIPPSFLPDAAEPETPAPPRAFVDFAGEVRYLGASEVVAMGPSVRGVLPFGPWSASLWLRYVDMVGRVGPQIGELEVSELVVGAGVGYAPLVDPVRLSFGLYGGVAVVNMESVGEDNSDASDVETGAADGRIGAEARLTYPIAWLLRGVAGIDGDAAPASFGNMNRRLSAYVPRMPAFTLGGHIGVEVAVP